jgi:hypothetical protein
VALAAGTVAPRAAAEPAPKAGAAKPPPADVAAANDLWKRGREAAKSEDWKKAAELFRESQRLDPSPGTLFNLANAEEKSGQLVAARQHFQEVILVLKPTDQRLAVAKDRAASLEQRVPRLRLDLAAGSPPFAKVRLGDEDVAPGREMLLDPGPRQVVVSAPGRPDRATDLTLAEGDRKALTLEVAPEPPPPAPVVAAPPPPPPTSPVNVRLVAGIGLGALGLVGIGVGAATGAAALGKKNALESACPEKSACTNAGVDMAGSGSTLATVSTVTFVVGAAAVAGGVVLVLTSRPKRAAPTTAIAPAPGGLLVRGTF